MTQSDDNRDEYDEDETEVVTAEPAGYADDDEVGEKEPDVFLDVPVLNIDEIQLDVHDLRAHVSLQAEVLDLLKLNVGADVALGSVELDIKGVEAQAQLKVRLHNVATIVNRVLTTIDRNPEILDQLGKGLGKAVEDVGSGAGRAAGEIGRGAGDAAESVGQGAGDAVRDVGHGAGEAVEDVGEGAGEAVEDVGEGAGEAVEDVGEGAGEAVEDVGEGAGETAQDVGKGAKGAAENLGESAGEAAEDAGKDISGSASNVAGDVGREAADETAETADTAQKQTRESEDGDVARRRTPAAKNPRKPVKSPEGRGGDARQRRSDRAARRRDTYNR
ncbi:hypothetical protein GCM10011583_35420 [Streptomyces camponoticapitis]|uniref:Mannose-1-phosphate guanylyltransferase (GDP) n=1 Tax=Streptomyces camponoticapitis TaxID=1616125 RepID=A0ABQ2E8E4_9ACTN|nr:hypothetical protein [Streptomyces camponoticapitis]GGK00851.1 hypothetical protein GCM10011583_35420 [Streptomyces camponoticapitis]